MPVVHRCIHDFPSQENNPYVRKLSGLYWHNISAHVVVCSTVRASIQYSDSSITIHSIFLQSLVIVVPAPI